MTRGYLLDTSVVSEWTKPRPDQGVVEWLREVDEDEVFLSVITLSEIRHGVDRLPAGKRRALLDHWLSTDLTSRFEGRLIWVDPAIADQAGRLVAHCEAKGRSLNAMDALIAATATVYDLTLTTRNVADFEQLAGLATLFNPWKGVVRRTAT